jgi:phosphatidylglycerophosphate synthase
MKRRGQHRDVLLQDISAHRTLPRKGANIITSLRYVFGVAIVVLFYVHSRSALVGIVGIVCLSALSDLVDGPVARRTRQATKPDGAVFDPLADDFVILSGLLCLLSASIAPLWFAALVLWVRASLVLVRMLGAVRHEPYAVPRKSTRASMAGLYIGEAALFAGYAAGDWVPWLAGATARNVVLGAMSALVAVAAADFVGATHRRTLVALFTTGNAAQRASERSEHQEVRPGDHDVISQYSPPRARVKSSDSDNANQFVPDLAQRGEA